MDVTVIDYGRGNLLSVSRALEYCGATVRFAKTEDEVKKAGHLILPGVGAFSDAMKRLKGQGLIESLKNHGASGRPLLGICLGMQIMLDTGEEFGQHTGLGLIPGRVTKIPKTNSNGIPHKIPHIGWNELHTVNNQHSWSETILRSTNPQSAAYFVHSFNCEPKFKNNCIAGCDYNGLTITAAISDGNIYGCQFHPEKSGPVGLEILNQFLKVRN
jgi:glutamine amidotransferase